MNVMNRNLRLAVAIGLSLTGFIAMAPAVADVPRHQMATVGLHTNVAAGADQHNYILTFNPCDGTLQGTGSDTVLGYDEILTCSFVGSILSCDGVYVPMGGGYDGYEFTYTWDVMSGPNGIASAYGDDYPTVFTVTGVVNSTWRNHGAFVAANPDKNDAAHSCIGMPIKSNKNK